MRLWSDTYVKSTVAAIVVPVALFAGAVFYLGGPAGSDATPAPAPSLTQKAAVTCGEVER